jgi:mRNA-degrading endonuclease RelE of RelBE toxin-antitoxin system
MQTVAETTEFQRQVTKLRSDDERRELIDFLAKNPTAGDPIPGTNGVRKLRFAAKGKGKSGGARVIYYFYDETLPLYALMAYGKGEKDNLSPDQKKAVAAFAEALKAMARS